jgi:hypothetical protein
MAARVQLNNFRFSIYIDADGTVTLTDLPPELREVVEALDPAYQGGTICAIAPPSEAVPPAQDLVVGQTTAEAPSEDLGGAESRD